MSRLFHSILERLLLAALSLGLIACGGGDTGTSPSLFASNYQGRWTGNIAVTSCKATEASQSNGTCDYLTGGPFNMTLTQSGRTVTAVFDFGGPPFPQTTGEIDSAGKLQISSTSVGAGGRVSAAWHLSIVSSVLAGTMDVHGVPDNPADGEVTFSGTITRAMRQS